MMGEVAKPGVVTIPGEKINMLEAIALAGDLTALCKQRQCIYYQGNK